MKPKAHNLNAWADAHVFYDLYEYDTSKRGEKAAVDEYQWKCQVLEDSPHGKLLTQNSFFDELKGADKIYLAHVTPNIHNIQKDNILYSSAGCLVGSIYCVPVLKENGKLRMHNLGEFIFKKEMPLFSNFIKPKPTRPLAILLIEIDLPKDSKTNLVGTDYLRLGDIHYQTFKGLEYLLSLEEKRKLKEVCVNRIRRALSYFCICNRAYFSNDNLNPSNFLELFRQSIEAIPILGYFYFEILSEYIMLYQDNRLASFFHRLGEFYSPSYKELVFYLCPKLSKHFTLTQFRPSFKEVVDYIQKRGIFLSLDTEHLLSYLTKRLVFLTNTRLLSDNSNKLINWKRLEWDFDELYVYMGPLLGHLIHRELRTFGRYPHFYFYFDQVKALQIWNYWNHMNIIIPFNGIMPKGEIGINPAYPELNYKIYSTKTYKESEKMYIEPEKKEDIKIVPKLVDPKFTTMGENKKEAKR